MKRWTIILIAIIIVLLILILIFNNYGSTPDANYYAEMERQMRSLWY